MNMSNRLTFSILSIFLLLAFVAVPVWSHTPGDGYDAAHDGFDTDGTTRLSGAALDAEIGHTHTPAPTVSSISAENTKGAVTAGGTLEDNVEGKNIVLVNDVTAADATRVLIPLTDHDSDTATPEQLAAGGFMLKITFNEDVYPVAAAAETAPAPPTLAATDVFTGVVRLAATQNGVDVSTSFTVGTLTRVETSTTGVFSKREFLVPITVAAGLTADQIPVSLHVTVQDDQVYSLTKIVGGKTIQGRGNAESSQYTFTILGELPEAPAPADNTAPTLTITKDVTDGEPLPASGNVTFTFTFSEEPGANDNGFSLGDVTITNGRAVDFGGSGMVYTLEVTPTDPMMDVTVSVAANAVADAAGNNLAEAKMETYMADDTENPTVTITSVRGTGDDADKIIVTFTFSEPLEGDKTKAGAFTSADIDRTQSNVLLAGEPMMSDDDPKVYTLVVTPPATGSATIVLKTGSVADSQGNVLQGDQPHTYTPTPAETPATITAPALGTTTAGGMLTVTFSKDPGTVATAATGYMISTAAGTTRTITVPNDKASGSHSIALTWDNGGSGTVTYMIPAAEVNTSPNITIKAGAYVVVVRDDSLGANTMGKILNDYDSSIVLAAWSDMPDLQNLFETGVPLTGAAHGGGALILRQSDGTSLHPGTVGISEIMWAIDESQLNNEVARKADQWIELHNLNGSDVTVKLSWKTGAKAIAADTNINGDLAAPYLDVVTNVFHDRPGNAHWTMPGQNGNPIIGKNFVSAARKGTFDLNAIHDGKRTKRYTRTDRPAGDQKSKSADGRNKDQWEASTVRYAYRTDTITTSDNRSFNVAYEDHGTPGRINSFSPERADTRVARTGVPFNTVVFNEIANRSNEAYEWIELRNVSGGEINLRNYLISIVESKPSQDNRDKPDNDKIFYQFPANDNAKIAAGGVFLLVASDPRGNPDHPLAVGYNVDLDEEDQVVGTRKNRINYKVMRKSDNAAYQYEGSGLPESGKFILILRRPDNHEGHRSGADGGKGVAERGKDDLDKIVDVAGYHDDLKITNYPNVVSTTNLWPLRNFEALNFNRNQFSPNTVHHRTNLSSRGSHNDHRAAWQDVGYSGIGYKHQAADSAAHGGTPGSHGNIKGKVADGKVIISEIMLSQGERGNLPQWIELYNPSKTNAVNLADNAGWRLVIENPDRAPIITINFKNRGNVKYIPPNSTVLVVSSSARDYGSDTLPRGTVFPDTRVLNAYTAIRGETFEIGRGDPLLDPKAFNVRLLDGTTTNNKPDGRYAGVISDEIGNLDGNPRTNDAADWEFPKGMTADGDRTSLIRIFDEGVARDGTGAVEPLAGTRGMKTRMDKVVDMKYSWVHAVDTAGYSQLVVRHTWFGDESDYGSPADRTGQTLPVELSHFRPTLEDGKVTIRWTTESELNNAGFNILRSVARDGEFKQVNAALIQGHGTTGERHTYKWVDESAKPGVVYFYQIEDVSFAGERQVLTMTKLKGLISAAGKATTTWGELKEVQ